MPLHDTEPGVVLPEANLRRVVSTVTPVVPKSLKYLRALLLVMAVLLALNTLGRLGVVWRYGVSPGTSPVIGAAVLATVGMIFLLACVGAFLLLGVPAKGHWWLMFVLPVLTIANIATAFAIIPSDHVGVGLVLDAYLCNGLLTVVLVILLLKRRVRAYFGISRPAAHAKAA
jgi:hypothetical protein